MGAPVTGRWHRLTGGVLVRLALLFAFRAADVHLAERRPALGEIIRRTDSATSSEHLAWLRCRPCKLAGSGCIRSRSRRRRRLPPGHGPEGRRSRRRDPAHETARLFLIVGILACGGLGICIGARFEIEPAWPAARPANLARRAILRRTASRLPTRLPARRCAGSRRPAPPPRRRPRKRNAAVRVPGRRADDDRALRSPS